MGQKIKTAFEVKNKDILSWIIHAFHDFKK